MTLRLLKFIQLMGIRDGDAILTDDLSRAELELLETRGLLDRICDTFLVTPAAYQAVLDRYHWPQGFSRRSRTTPLRRVKRALALLLRRG